MKRKWIFMSLVTGLIMLAGVLFIDFYRNTSGTRNNPLDEVVNLEESTEDASPVIQPKDDSKPLDRIDSKSNEGETSEEVTHLEEAKANFVIFGDVLIHENVLANANRYAGGSGGRDDYGSGFDFKPIFENVGGLISGADYAVINQSSLAGANDAPSALSGYPKFNGPSSVSNDYISLGFQGVNIASNHALDLGAEGWKNVLRVWKDKNIKAIGAYENDKEFREPESKIIDVNGIRVACLSYVSDTNYHLIAQQDLGIPLVTVNGALKKKMVEDDVAACRQISDAVIVWIWWSGDASFETTEYQQETAQFLANTGVDVILGNGPKVLQRTEWIETDSGGKTLCAYSLGNTVCTMQYIENLLGGVLSFSLEKDTSGQVTVKNVVVEPTMIVYDENIDHLRVVKLSEFTEQDFDAHGSNILYGKGRYDWLSETVKKQIDEAFLPAVYR